jgi:geranylgeranyl diphosphate synthase type I
VLGVFGDPEVTGKPAGDDLREGKRTVLVGLTRETLTASAGRIFDELLTSRELDANQIAFLQQTIIDSGALEKSERMINELADESLLALADLAIDDTAKANLKLLAERVINRQS